MKVSCLPCHNISKDNKWYRWALSAHLTYCLVGHLPIEWSVGWRAACVHALRDCRCSGVDGRALILSNAKETRSNETSCAICEPTNDACMNLIKIEDLYCGRACYTFVRFWCVIGAFYITGCDSDVAVDYVVILGVARLYTGSSLLLTLMPVLITSALSCW
jgi:hypothetical protein